MTTSELTPQETPAACFYILIGIWLRKLCSLTHMTAVESMETLESVPAKKAFLRPLTIALIAILLSEITTIWLWQIIPTRASNVLEEVWVSKNTLIVSGDEQNMAQALGVKNIPARVFNITWYEFQQFPETRMAVHVQYGEVMYGIVRDNMLFTARKNLEFRPHLLHTLSSVHLQDGKVMMTTEKSVGVTCFLFLATALGFFVVITLAKG